MLYWFESTELAGEAIKMIKVLSGILVGAQEHCLGSENKKAEGCLGEIFQADEGGGT